jgi:hypothetical protein
MFLRKKDGVILSLKEASKILNYHPDYISYLIRSGKLKGVKNYSQKKWLISVESFLPYLEKKKTDLKEQERLRELSKSQTFISLKEAAKISGLTPDYLGYLVRKGEIFGKKIYSKTSWGIREKDLRRYLKIKEGKGFYRLFKLLKPQFIFLTSVFFIFLGLINFSLSSNSSSKSLRIYPIKIEGNWGNLENAIGAPEVTSKGSLSLFSEKNSAVYRGGQKSIILSKFLLPENRLGLINRKFPDIKIKFSFAFGEEEPEFQIITKKKNFLFSTVEAKELSVPLIDPGTKIIIWWSLDGQNWQKLDTISDYLLSNAQNSGYFEYDAPFLKNWEDIKNLKIKFEGVIGGENNLTAYLDSLWLEVDYLKK